MKEEKMNHKIIAPIVMFGIICAGCAKKAEDIKPSYVPKMEYSNKSCHQLRDEVIEINREMRVIAGVQDDTAKKDQVAMGVGLVLFWPALFFLANGEDNQRKIAELKGRYEAVKIVSKEKKCSFAKDLK